MSGERQPASRRVIGILFPGYSAEDEYPRMERLLGGDIGLPLAHTRLLSDDHTVEAMGAAGDEHVLAEGARELAPHHLDAIMWACTSGSFAYGWEHAKEQAHKLSEVADVPASSTSFAFVEAAQHIGVESVVIAATYPHDLADKFTAFLRNADIDVLGLVSNDITTASAAGEAGKEDVMGFVQRAAARCPDADAILVPDTALHSVDWLRELEAHAAKPVLTANQVTVWHGMKLAGADLVRPNLGTLFEDV